MDDDRLLSAVDADENACDFTVANEVADVATVLQISPNYSS